MCRNVLLFCGVILWSLAGMSFDFHAADALYSKRENNRETIARSRALYQQALKGGDIDEVLYAVEQLGRLAYYEGELLLSESDHSTRRTTFQQCQDDVESISPAKIGKEMAAYYYWKSACLAMWAKSAKPWSVPGRAHELEDAMNKGLELDSSYEGGGVHRVMGAVYLKSKMLSWVPGLSGFYDPAKALQHIEKAIDAGPEFYNAYMIKAEILKELGRENEGEALLRQKIQELQMREKGSNLPKGLEAESKMIRQKMAALLDEW